MNKIKVIVICGPTASGKTSLAVELAKRVHGEVVCADSMQIYKGMDIATAKPTIEEMQGIPHHIVDFLEPSEPFSVADYVELAHKVIAEISVRGSVPIICGGTGLYIDSLTENIQFQQTVTKTPVRDELKALAEENGNAYLLEMLREIDPETAERLHENNISRIIRAIEVYKTTGVTMSEQIRQSKSLGSPYSALRICLDYRDRAVLYERIDKRVDIMLENGLLDEAKKVLADSTLQTARQAIGYKELAPYFAGELPLEDCVDNLKRSTRRYAKRQLTWFRRNTDTVWLYPDELGESLADRAAEIAKVFLKGEQDEIQKIT